MGIPIHLLRPKVVTAVVGSFGNALLIAIPTVGSPDLSIVTVKVELHPGCRVPPVMVLSAGTGRFSLRLQDSFVGGSWADVVTGCNRLRPLSPESMNSVCFRVLSRAGKDGTSGTCVVSSEVAPTFPPRPQLPPLLNPEPELGLSQPTPPAHFGPTESTSTESTRPQYPPN